jgi:diguanylate cyclase
MIYTDDTDKTSELFRLTISFLSKYKIPANPQNYHLAYDYVSGNSKDLIDDLNTLLDQSELLDPKKLFKLYKKHFLPDYETFDTIRHELREVLTRLINELGTSESTLTDYAKKLTDFVNLLDQHNPAENILHETNSVIDETQSVGESQAHLNSNLSSALSEVNALRKELKKAKKELKTDSLTGIANRKAFDAAITERVNLSKHKGMPFCLLLLDIDHFKKFNDTYGHLIGDKVLRFVANTLKLRTKGHDMIARFGGEEFVVILPEADINGGLSVAQQLCNAVSSGKLSNKEKGISYGKITISVGVSQFRAADNPKQLINRADKALYLAKKRGRNRVEKL